MRERTSGARVRSFVVSSFAAVFAANALPGCSDSGDASFGGADGRGGTRVDAGFGGSSTGGNSGASSGGAQGTAGNGGNTGALGAGGQPNGGASGIGGASGT